MSDPYVVMGVTPGATPRDVRAARLALAKALHPDLRGADRPERRAAAERRLAEINAAYDLLAAQWQGRPTPATRPTPVTRPTPARDSSGPPADAGPVGIVIGMARVAAFEALVVAAADAGDITDADPPFSLEVHVDGPPNGFCRLELVPEAGASMVALDSDQVDAAAVARVLLLALERLGVPAQPLGIQ